MKGIILAAGKGSRLNGTLGDKPKCLLRVGDRTLVERQIESLRASGIDDIAGENLGIVKFGAEGARLLTRMLDERVTGGHLRDWAPSAFGDFARRRPLHVIGTRGYPWTEIDFPEDYERAIHDVLPAIDGKEGPTHRSAPTTVSDHALFGRGGPA